MNIISPQIWKTAHISPILKKGDPTNPSNYRPIALTCIFCKIMETIIKNEMLSYLSENNIISSKQHAFLKKCSTTTNLLECTREWSLALDCGKAVDIIYIDFERAFDSIVHSELILKLTSIGTCDNLLRWIGCFISNRVQSVVVDNCVSDYCTVTSGIIQGSVLGPLLFIVFINDLTDILSTIVKLKLFADDLKLFTCFHLCNQLLSNDLQIILNEIFCWSVMWQLTINLSKCSCMRLLSRFRLSNTIPSYYLNGTLLAVTTNTRDLGIIIDCKLAYTTHISTIVTKANQRVGLLFRGFKTRDIKIMRKAYITYIRPLLEYNSVVWSPCTKKYIDLIEDVQRHFTKRIPSLNSLSYPERLAAMKLQPLELRRLHSDLIQYFKIFNNMTPLNPSDFFTTRTAQKKMRNNGTTLLKPTKATNYIFHSFAVRSINCWNNLPAELKEPKSINTFKSKLRCIDLQSYLCGSNFTSLSDFTGIPDIVT